jgi:hypothetical protein
MHGGREQVCTKFWVVVLWSEVVGYHPKDGVGMVHRNIGILPHHYTVSQPGRPRPESSLP